MKSLNNYISEWKANTQSIKNVNSKYFVYNIIEEKEIKIFDRGWNQFGKYRQRIYLNDKHISIDSQGYTEPFLPGKYEFEIKDIDDINDCRSMFAECKNLIYVPVFNISSVKDMSYMFWRCTNLKKVPLFDTKNITCLDYMFVQCDNLDERTKKDWSFIYNFETHKMKK